MQRGDFFKGLAALFAVPFVAAAVEKPKKISVKVGSSVSLDFSHWVVEGRAKGTEQWKTLCNNVSSDLFFVPTESPGKNEYQSFGFDLSGRLVSTGGLTIQEVPLPMEISHVFESLGDHGLITREAL